MAVVSFSEGTQFPSSPEQYDLFFRQDLGTTWVQVEPKSVAVEADIVAAGGLTRSNNVVTVVCAASHGLSVGERVDIAGASDSTFDGRFEVSSIVDALTFTYIQVGANATSGGGKATPVYPMWVELSDDGAVNASRRLPGGMPWANYFARDYQTFLDEGLSWLKRNVGSDVFDAYRDSDVVMLLMKYVAAALDQAAWYLDMEVAQQYLPTTSVRSRVSKLASFLGYAPHGASPSRVDVTISLETVLAFDVTIKEGLGFLLDGNRWEVENDVTIPAGNLAVSATLRQTRTDEVVAVSDGSRWQQVGIVGLDDGEEVADGLVNVWVDGDLWSEVDALAPGDGKAFSVFYLSELVRFGDGISGQIPAAGAEILVRYSATYGKGASAGASASWAQDDVLTVNGTDITLTVSNVAASSGGDSSESVDEVKTAAPRWFATADRGVTEADIEALAEQQSGVSVADAAKVRNLDHDTELAGYLDAVETERASIVGGVSNISGEVSAGLAGVTNSDGKIDSATASVDSAKTKIGEVRSGFSELKQKTQAWAKDIVGHGNGSDVVFATTLSRAEVVANSVVVYVDDMVVEQSGADGDLDSTTGRLAAASGAFSSADVGKPIRIGGELRGVAEVLNATTIVYTGEPLTGTGQVWVLYGSAVVGHDDGNGMISGPGIVSGTVAYSTGAVQVTFTSAPGGAGQYGAPVVCEYNWKNAGAESFIDDLDTDLGDADSRLDEAKQSHAEAKVYNGAVGAALTLIQTDVAGVEQDAGDLKTAMDNLETYLGVVISSSCRANVIRLRILTEDEDGNYIAPSTAQLDAVRAVVEKKVVSPAALSVVSGYWDAVKADVVAKVFVEQPYKFESVEATVRETIVGLLRGRKFGEDLFVSDIYSALVWNGTTGIKGVKHANISITGTSWAHALRTGAAPGVNSDGNLVVGDAYVIVAGAVSVSEGGQQ